MAENHPYKQSYAKPGTPEVPNIEKPFENPAHKKHLA